QVSCGEVLLLEPAFDCFVQLIEAPTQGRPRCGFFRQKLGQAGTVQDADGKPLAGAWVAGLTDSWPITYTLPEPTAIVYALDPEKPRTLVVFHAGKKLGGTEPVIVKLGPVGKVTGRLLEDNGSPLAGAAVSINSSSPIARELYRFANPTGQRVLTDKDGRFTL